MLGELLEKADIRKTEFAALVMVDRRSVHNWINGMEPRNHHIKAALDAMSEKVIQALQEEQLPVKHLVGKERLRALRLILK